MTLFSPCDYADDIPHLRNLQIPEQRRAEWGGGVISNSTDSLKHQQKCFRQRKSINFSRGHPLKNIFHL